VYVARADGSQRSVVASVNPIDECFSADWSPRGTQLVFRTGCDNDFTSLYVVRGNGTGLRRLARDFWTLGPTWSPDGGSILFAGSPPGHRGSFALFLTDACGRKPLRIPGLWFNWYPSTDWAWAREGRRVFVLLDTSHTNRGLELSVLGRRGGRLHQLTPPDLDVGAFEVSPDDGRIVLQAAIGSRDWEIYVMRSDGTGLTPLTDNRSQDRDPHWSADGKRILFTSERDGNSEIYVMNDDGSSQTNLTRDPARDDSPSWIP
jgi:TolB protein